MKNKWIVPIFALGIIIGSTATALIKENVIFKDNNFFKEDIMVLAEDTEPLPENIVNHTLGIGDTIYLGYYVSDTVAKKNNDKVDVYVWKSLNDANNFTEPDYICDLYTGSGNATNYDLFLLNGLSYKNMVDVLYAREVRTDNGGVKHYSSVDDYSMLDYCYNHYDDTSKLDAEYNCTLGELIEEMVDYASKCQQYFGYKDSDDQLANALYKTYRKKLCKVSINGATSVAVGTNYRLNKLLYNNVSQSTLVIDFEEQLFLDSYTINYVYYDSVTFNFVDGSHIKNLNLFDCHNLSFYNLSSDEVMLNIDSVEIFEPQVSFYLCDFLFFDAYYNNLSCHFKSCTFTYDKATRSMARFQSTTLITVDDCEFISNDDEPMAPFYVLNLNEKVDFKSCTFTNAVVCVTRGTEITTDKNYPEIIIVD